MAFVVENLRLKELAIVAEQNKPPFEYFVEFVIASGYPSLQGFVFDSDVDRAKATILRFLQTPLPVGVIPPKISGVQEWNFLGKISEEIYDEERTI